MRWLSLFSRSGTGNVRRANTSRTLRRRVSLTFELLEDRNLPSFTITPTFDSTIASDPNAATIESTIDSAISFYESAFANPINVTIKFQEGGGLGSNNITFYKIPYATFRAALAAEPQTADTATALANLPIQTDNPVNNDPDLLLKTADIRALGIPGSFPPHGGFDGVISLNTAITTPGSPGSNGKYSLFATVEHEIDEVLGLGSALPSTGSGSFPPSDPMPEDLYRYTAEGARTWIVTGDDAWFSLDGTTDLVQFNQGNVNDNEGDYGDWWSDNGSGNAGLNPPARVQDAVLLNGASPTLATDSGQVELTALNVIGYTPIVTLSPASLPADTVNVAYNQSITASGGTGSETFAVTNIQNPIAGLNVPATASGTLPITGTPTATGTETFTVTATDQADVVTEADCSITVNPAVALSPTGLPAGFTFALYNPTIAASGGTGTLTLAIANYQDGGTGLSEPTISGNQASFDSTPSAPGTVSFDLTVTDAVGAQVSQTYTFTVVAAPQITTASLATYWTAGAAGYNQTIAAHGGTGALTFSVSAGALPTGLTLDPTSGALMGMPTTAGSFPFTVTVTDTLGVSASQAYTVVIVPSEFVYDQNAHTLVITLTPALPNFEYTQLTTANGGAVTSAYTFTLSSSGNTISQTFPDAALTTAPALGATVTVIGQGSAGTAILILNDTYVDGSGVPQETPERVSLGSPTDAGVGTVSKFVGNSTSNASYNFLSLSNFPISYAYVGRNDGTVTLYGTAGTGTIGFVTAGYYSYIAAASTGTFFHLAAGAPSVYGYSAGNANDFAYHYSMNAGSAYVVSGVAFSYMSGSQTNPEDSNATDTFYNVGAGFPLNTGVSNNPGQDIAYIIDSPMNDTFNGGDAYSYMYSTDAAGNFTEFDAAFGLALIYAESFVGGTDTAVNNDPSKNVLGGDWHVQ